MFRAICAIEESYIEMFPFYVSEDDDEDPNTFSELMHLHDMTWSRIGMLAELGYLDSFPDVDDIDENEKDPKKYIQQQINLERSFLPDAALKTILGNITDRERFVKKAFDAARGNQKLLDTMNGLFGSKN